MPKNNPGKFKMEYAAAGAVIGILCCILFVRPIIGVADNGDFSRIMGPTGLYYLSRDPEERYFGYVNRLFGTGFINPFGAGYLSTEIPVVLMAVLLNKSFLRTDLFDVRFLAAIYIIAFAAAAFLAVRYIRRFSAFSGIAAALTIILIFCDTGYTSYFNSLYGEPVTFVSLALMVAAALALACENNVSRRPALWQPLQRREISRVPLQPPLWALILFGVSAVIFAGAKVQNTAAGLLSAPLFIGLAKMRSDRVWKNVSAALGVSVVIVTMMCYLGVAKDIRTCNKYQSVFYGILKGSDNPAADLDELGLDRSLALLAGTNYFMEQYPVNIKTPEFKKMIYERINHTKVAAFYIRHPGRLLRKLEYAAENGFMLNQRFGNYEKYPGISYKQVTDVSSLWGRFKLNMLPHTFLFVLIFYCAAVIVSICEYKKAAGSRPGFLPVVTGYLAVTGITQFVLPVIGDGDADLAKHLFLFNLCSDLLFFTAIIYICTKAVAAVRFLRLRATNLFADKTVYSKQKGKSGKSTP